MSILITLHGKTKNLTQIDIETIMDNKENNKTYNMIKEATKNITDINDTTVLNNLIKHIEATITQLNAESARMRNIIHGTPTEGFEQRTHYGWSVWN